MMQYDIYKAEIVSTKKLEFSIQQAKVREGNVKQSCFE